jgi:hypothetical protein
MMKREGLCAVYSDSTSWFTPNKDKKRARTGLAPKQLLWEKFESRAKITVLSFAADFVHLRQWAAVCKEWNTLAQNPRPIGADRLMVLTKKQAQRIPQSVLVYFSTNSNLERIHLSGGVIALKKISTFSTRNLQQLHLEGYDLDYNSVQLLTRVLESQPNILHVALPKNRLGCCDAGKARKIREIAAGMAHTHPMRTKLLVKTDILDSGAIWWLIKSVQKAKGVTFLDLSDNQLTGNDNAPHITSILQSSVLRYLNVSSNRLGCSGASEVASCLARNKVLTECDMRRNRIGKAGAEAIIGALTQGDDAGATQNSTLKVRQNPDRIAYYQLGLIFLLPCCCFSPFPSSLAVSFARYSAVSQSRS